MYPQSLKLVTPSTALPVSVSEMYEQTHRDDTSIDTASMTGAIQAAWRYAEQYQRRAILQETWRAQWDSFPYYEPQQVLELPLSGPLATSNVAIGYVDTDGTTQTMATSDYTVHTESEPPRIQPVYGGVWPQARSQVGAVTVTFTIGYSASTDIPGPTRQAIKLQAAHWDANREGSVVGAGVNEIPFGVHALLDCHKVSSY